MALELDDLTRIADLVDARIAARLEADRAARRWRRWPFAVLGMLVLGGTVWAGLVGVRAVQDWVAARDAEFTEVKLAYQRELAKNAEWQRTRAAAEQALHYQPKRTQAEHEAALMNQALELMTEQSKLKEKWATLDFNDPKSMEVLSNDLGRVLEQGMGAIGQVVLRNSDPAHNTAEERIRQDAAGDLIAPAAPLTLTPAPAPNR